jgi:DNA adenine methylase
MAKNGPIKYHGGKSYSASWIHSHAPPSVRVDPESGYTHRNYPYAGGLGELWGWECEGVSETINDLDKELINFWSVFTRRRDFEHFFHMASFIPLGQPWFEEAKCRASNADRETVQAVKFFITNRMSRQGLGRDYTTPTIRTRRGMNEQVSAWLTAVDGLWDFYNRFIRVEVRCMDGCEFIDLYDHARALFYLDPPYMHETRANGKGGEYRHEMTVKQHQYLLSTLAGIKGRFMLSGYPSKLYERFAERNGWRCARKLIDNKASSKKTKEKKTECLWMNYAMT